MEDYRSVAPARTRRTRSFSSTRTRRSSCPIHRPLFSTAGPLPGIPLCSTTKPHVDTLALLCNPILKDGLPSFRHRTSLAQHKYEFLCILYLPRSRLNSYNPVLFKKKVNENIETFSKLICMVILIHTGCSNLPMSCKTKTFLMTTSRSPMLN